MKKIGILFLAFLLIGCTNPAGETTEAPGTEPTEVTEESVVSEVKVIEKSDIFEEGGALVALLDPKHSTLATLSAVQLGGVEAKPGDVLTVTHAGIFLESYPEQFGSVQKVEKAREEPDQVGLVWGVYEIFAKADPVLVDGIIELGLDLKNAHNLLEIEKRALLWKFESVDRTVIEGTFEELKEQGYITGELSWKEGKGAFFQFSTTTVNEEKTELVFDTRLWKTGMASLGSDGVTAKWENGTWTQEGGSHYISKR